MLRFDPPRPATLPPPGNSGSVPSIIMEHNLTAAIIATIYAVIPVTLLGTHIGRCYQRYQATAISMLSRMKLPQKARMR